jgi:hypothetical protein
MELQIINFIENQNPILIKDFDNLKSELVARAEYYNGLHFTEDQVKEAKAERANLNKFKDTIETRRKEIKKAFAAPYMALEAQVKELNAIIDEPINKIDSQIKVFEERKKSERQEELKAFYAENAQIEKIADIVEFEKIFEPKWLNASVSAKSAKEEIVAKITQIKNDLAAIDMLDGKYKLSAKDYYLRTFNLSGAIAEHNRLLELEKRVSAATPESTPAAASDLAPEPAQAEPADADETHEITVRFIGKKSYLKKVFELARTLGVSMKRVEVADGK